MDSSSSNSRAQRSPLAFIFVTVFVDLLGYGIMIPLLPYFVQEQHAGAFFAGALGSVYALMQLVSGPILGELSDRHGRRPVLLVCLLGTATAFLLLGLANSLALIFLAVALDGITGGNLTTAYAYIADITTPENRARGMGLVGAAFGLGLMLGPALGGLLSAFGLSVPAFVACAIALANVIFGWRVLPESLLPEKRKTTSEHRALNWVAQLRGVIALPTLRALLLAMFLLNLAFAGLQTNFPLFSQARFGWDSTRNGFFFAFVGVCAVLIQGVLFGKIQPVFGEKRRVIGGLGLMMASLAAIAVAPQDWMVYPIVALGALGSGTSIPSLTSLVSQRVDAREQGRLMGGTQAILSLAMIVGPTIAGASFDAIAITAPYWLGSVFAASALVIASRALKT
ncbi:MAG: MFS transporter [Chloroflexi bacterium]|nr:MFS transporter [Chloroflexota bacterium]